jgi:RimJ/RimL family protein N-acetyltransferase
MAALTSAPRSGWSAATTSDRSGAHDYRLEVGDTDATDPAVTLSDEVVTLRPWSRADAGFMVEAFVDPAIRRYNGALDPRGRPGPPLSIVDAEGVIDEFASRSQTFAATGTPTGVAFAITEASSGDLVGCCGVDDWSKADVAQFGYWIAPSARGHGYATRAAVVLTRWLFGLGAARVFLTIVAGNEASAAVARRAGFVHEGTLRAHAVWEGRRCDVMWFAALPLEAAPRVDDVRAG